MSSTNKDSQYKEEEPSEEFKKLVEADKKTILERALKASLEEMSRRMDKMNLGSSSSTATTDSDSGIFDTTDSQKTELEEIYDLIFGSDSEDEEVEIGRAWEKILKEAKEAFKLSEDFRPDSDEESS